MNLATWITISRLLGIPLILYSLYLNTPEARWLGLGVFLVAAGTDWLDGYLARRLNQVTDLGKFLDPLVDKLLVLAPLLVLIELGQIPAWGVFLILMREMAIAGWRVTQTQITGANLWGQAQNNQSNLGSFPADSTLPNSWSLVSLVVFWIAVALTLISGGIYLWPRSTPLAAKSKPDPS